MTFKYNSVEWDDSGNATIPTVRTNGVTLTDGAALKTTTTDTDTALIQAYDVNGAAYVDFITLTAGNTPTCDLNADTTIGANPIANGGANANITSMSGLTGAVAKPSSITTATGGALRTDTSAGNTTLLQAYDVDGATYVTFGTLTANDTPTFSLSTSTLVGTAAINAIVGSGGIKSFQIFTSGTAQTYTKPANVSSILVECVGGGAGAGGVASSLTNGAVGGGGGSGAYCRKYIASAASTYTYTVGAGGAAGTAGANNGSNGTASTFTDGGSINMSAGGGGFGAGQTATTMPGAGAGSGNGGTATGGDINGHGGGAVSGCFFLTSLLGSYGGNSIMGGGGQQLVTANGSSAGAAGNNYGSGGSGAITHNDTTNRAGGAGADGIIIVWELA